MRLSQATARKQVTSRRTIKGNPQDWDIEYYAYVQRAIEEGQWFESAKPNHIEGIVEIDGKAFRVVLKRTEDKSELYLVTAYMVGRSDRKMRRAQMRLKRLK